MKRALRLGTCCFSLLAATGAGCAASRSDEGDESIDAGPDGDEDAAAPEETDSDGDGMPDWIDPAPDEPQEGVLDEDFENDPGWRAEGSGGWSWSPEGWVVQSAACDDRGSPTIYEPVDALSEMNLYAEAPVRVPACPGAP